jgi:DNA-binding transcriptional MocR family regulator
MNSGITSERVYASLKREILSGAMRPGAKLEPIGIAQDLMSSVTPVRDALHRLIGERLVESHSGEGFHLPHITEPNLEDLYAWHGEILALALRSGDRPVAAVFAHIASGSRNGEHRLAVEAAGDRLQLARRVEIRLFDDLRSELDGVRDAAEGGDIAELRKLLARYHRRRQRAIAMIVRSIYRDHQADGVVPRP